MPLFEETSPALKHSWFRACMLLDFEYFFSMAALDEQSYMWKELLQQICLYALLKSKKVYLSLVFFYSLFSFQIFSENLAVDQKMTIVGLFFQLCYTQKCESFIKKCKWNDSSSYFSLISVTHLLNPLVAGKFFGDGNFF